MRLLDAPGGAFLALMANSKSGRRAPDAAGLVIASIITRSSHLASRIVHKSLRINIMHGEGIEPPNFQVYALKPVSIAAVRMPDLLCIFRYGAPEYRACSNRKNKGKHPWQFMDLLPPT